MTRKILKTQGESLFLGGALWISEREKPLMEHYAALAIGDVLELGYGLGYAHQALHENPSVNSITTVERSLEVIADQSPCGCEIIHDSWEDALKVMEDRSFDTIFHDACLRSVPLQAALPLTRLLKDPWSRLMMYYTYEGGLRTGLFEIFRKETLEEISCSFQLLQRTSS